VTANGGQLTTDFMKVSSVRARTGVTLSVRKRFVVLDGQPGVREP
jgi:hypothetical protein